MSFNAARLYDLLPSGRVAESAGEQRFYSQGMGSNLTEVKKIDLSLYGTIFHYYGEHSDGNS